MHRHIQIQPLSNSVPIELSGKNLAASGRASSNIAVTTISAGVAHHHRNPRNSVNSSSARLRSNAIATRRVTTRLRPKSRNPK